MCNWIVIAALGPELKNDMTKSQNDLFNADSVFCSEHQNRDKCETNVILFTYKFLDSISYVGTFASLITLRHYKFPYFIILPFHLFFNIVTTLTKPAKNQMALNLLLSGLQLAGIYDGMTSSHFISLLTLQKAFQSSRPFSHDRYLNTGVLNLSFRRTTNSIFFESKKSI